MKWEEYTLSQQVRVQNSIGQFIPAWEEIGTIEVVVSNNLYTNVTNDIVYRIYAPTAISTYKRLEEDATYKIANADNEYEVTSINTGGRFAQLLLKKVVL